MLTGEGVDLRTIVYITYYIYIHTHTHTHVCLDSNLHSKMDMYNVFDIDWEIAE